MTIPMINYPEFRPYTNITPFTVRDGATYLLQIETLLGWIRNDLVPHIDKEIKELTENWDSTAVELISTWEQMSVELIARVELAESNLGNAVNETEAAKVAAEAARDLAAIYASQAEEIQDVAVTNIVNNEASGLRMLLDSVYASVDSLGTLSTELTTLSDSLSAAEAVMETGRLSASALDRQIDSARTVPVMGSDVTSGYARTVPTPVGVSTGIRMLSRDPVVEGRIWGQNLAGDRQVGFTDDSGATFVKKFVPPSGESAGIPSLRFWNGYAWLLQVPTTGAKRGRLYRSPYPDANGDGWNWTLVFDLASPPPGITTGDNSTVRADNVAGFGPNVWFTEYSPAQSGTTVGDAVMPGPSVYYSPNSGNTWYKVKTFANARHIHAIAIINGLPWLTIGDAGSNWFDRGLWSANKVGADALWSKRSVGENNPGWAANDLYPINIMGIDIAGAPMIVGESDGRHPSGPLVYQGQSVVGVRPLIEMNRVPLPFFGSMRHLTLTPEGNLMWLQTGERGAIGDFDTVMIARGPYFSEAIPVEALPALDDRFYSAGDSTLDGHYVWFGHNRIARPVFEGQALASPEPLPNPPVVPDPELGPDHEWDASLLTGIDADVVSWVDTIGSATFTATAPKAPKLVLSSGNQVVKFDGVDDMMDCAGIALTSPYTILIKARVITYGSFGGGLVTPNGAGLNVRYDSNGKPYAGILAGENGDVPLGTEAVHAFVSAGAESRMSINGTVYVGDTGPADTNNIRLGYVFQSSAARYSDIEISKLRIYRRALSEVELIAAIADFN